MRRLWRTLGYAGVLVVLCAGLAKSANDVPFPTGFRAWFAVNSMIVGKDSPLFSQIGGLHIVYANPKALATLRKGGPFPYLDGAVFADDVHDFTVKDGTTSEGPKKAVTVMVKDSTKYKSTGGWGFQVWAGGDPKKPLIDDATVPCYTCHTQRTPQDFVFSTWIP